MLNFKTYIQEAKLTAALEIKVDLGVSFPKGALKRTEAEELKREWDLYRSEIRKVVKPLGGLITDTVAPDPRKDQNSKRIGTVSVGTRGDASKLDPAKIKAALSKHVEVHDMKISKLNEDTKRCSDKCCGSDVKAEDCKCPADCPHCDCNAE